MSIPKVPVVATAHSCEDPCALARTRIRLLVVSDVRFYREGLNQLLPSLGPIDVINPTSDGMSALDSTLETKPDVVLLDAGLEGGVALVRSLRSKVPRIRIVAVAVGQDEHGIVRWAEAGVAGFVTRDQSLPDVARMIQSVAAGEAPCNGAIGATLLRRLTALSQANVIEHNARLTRREREVADLLRDGCTNKEIAARLLIELPTVKNHVRAVLSKLSVHRRAEIPARLLRD